MKRMKRGLAVLLAIVMVCSIMPISVAAAIVPTYTYTQISPIKATVTVTSGNLKSVSVDNTALATASVSGNVITVTGVTGGVGVATLAINYGGDSPCTVAVPIGYTTFVFDGDALTVMPGRDTKYEVTGINTANEEYTVDSGIYPLPVTTTAQGYEVYENTADYKLCVNIKKSGGVYAFSGMGEDMAIAVKKEATSPAVLLLTGLDLTSSFTAPLTIKKSSTTTVTVTSLAGHENCLTDAVLNNADIYGDPTSDGGDGTNAEYAESAVIKGKSYANITLNGTGKLTLNCRTKNAIKVGEYGSLTIKETDLTVVSDGNGLSADNTLTVESGRLNITAAGDGIRTDPDAVDSTLGCAGNIDIKGGDITIQSTGDAVQSAQDITITGGKFNLTTGKGYTGTAVGSQKGLKAAFNTDDISDTSTATNTIEITGGEFVFNTAEDALHADGYVVITGGNFDIQSGDDGIHADTSLTLGQEGGNESSPYINIRNSYEGLEAGNVYIYSGTHLVTATDDGINAAGDSTSGFNPGGQPGRPGRPGSGSNNTGTSGTAYNITVAGGLVTVNAGSDGIDANTNLNLTGGTILVWGNQPGGDGAPLDCDGSMNIQGATLLAAGSSSMMSRPSNASQPYITYSGNVATGKTINVKHNGTTVTNTKAIKNANYILYSSPDMASTGGWSIVIDDAPLLGDEEDPCADGHSWDSGSWIKEPSCTEGGQKLYECTNCDETYTEDVDPNRHEYSNGYCIHCSAEDPDAVWPTVTFVVDNATVTTYLTQDTTTPYETDAASAFARNSLTGTKDLTGEGQVNFAVTAAEGYEITLVTVLSGEGNYKNLKAIEGVDHLYRLTKITGDVVITVTTTKTDEPTKVLYGDIDADGVVTANDALMALQASTSKIKLSDQQMVVGDVDNVSGVSANDALAILQYATQKITLFPVDIG